MSSGPQSCKVWDLHQARCSLCGWSGEITGIPRTAAQEARDHRASEGHQGNLSARRENESIPDDGKAP